jgi:hypothetical protein
MHMGRFIPIPGIEKEPIGPNPPYRRHRLPLLPRSQLRAPPHFLRYLMYSRPSPKVNAILPAGSAVPTGAPPLAFPVSPVLPSRHPLPALPPSAGERKGGGPAHVSRLNSR